MNTHMIKKQLTSVYRYAYTNLALNYYTYFETVMDKTGDQEKLASYTTHFNRLLGDFLEGGENIEELDLLRNQVKDVMEALTAYADSIMIYEYVINRLERRFITGTAIPETQGEVISKVMQYICNSKDSVVVNGRISEVVEQLPVRFTRNKFFNMVSDSLSIYIGGERLALDNMMYFLRASAMIYLPESGAEGFEELHQMINELKAADYTKLTKEDYNRLTRLIEDAGQIVTDQLGDVMSFMELINDLYLMELSKSDAVVDLGEEEILKFITSGIMRKFNQEDWTEIEDEISEKLVFLEGRQESFYEKYLKYEIQDEEIEKPYDVILKKISVLMSGSSFASFEEPAAGEEKADRKWVEQETEKYFETLNQLFQGMKKPVMRAVMAQVLSKLPVCFNSVREIEDYIRNSLDSCTDIYEKETCMELLLDLVESENAYI
ncbi:hypothetical protein GPL15_24140 [Clostridium sp. MCC353]|uniref:hypothetical protein n=1 Tax=Clostridium sp. MCC353 TaxID=2592646 RepID=UPI001C039165|nr:hypothetical protein [Clostridium sp. MCC353]MBT9779573.1 hypothetical protein [Clostridium sp. MCC353]